MSEVKFCPECKKENVFNELYHLAGQGDWCDRCEKVIMIDKAEEDDL